MTVTIQWFLYDYDHDDLKYIKSLDVKRISVTETQFINLPHGGTVPVNKGCIQFFSSNEKLNTVIRLKYGNNIQYSTHYGYNDV